MNYYCFSPHRLTTRAPCNPRFLSVPYLSRGITGHPDAYYRNQAASTTALALIMTNKTSLEPVLLCQLLIIPTHSFHILLFHLTRTPEMVPKLFYMASPGLQNLFSTWQPGDHWRQICYCSQTSCHFICIKVLNVLVPDDLYLHFICDVLKSLTHLPSFHPLSVPRSSTTNTVST